jgi:hypothetical protein
MPFVITLASAPTWGNALKNGPGVSVCTADQARAVSLYREMVGPGRHGIWTVAEIEEPTIRRVLSRQELEKET